MRLRYGEIRPRRVIGIASLAFAAAIVCTAAIASDQIHYGSPQKAMQALVTALRADDFAALRAALGPEGDAVLFSGDDVADNQARDRFLAAYDKSAKLVDDGRATMRVEIGDDNWPFPIPLVHDTSGWRFDTAAGREEILNRRIGRNELSVIQVCLAYVDAQREYATFDRDGDRILEYAQRFVSTPGKKDGLYWEAKENEPQSPLGANFASAQAKGYRLPSTAANAAPASYYGYRYKILTSQGGKAAGGAFNYVVKGNMIGGFALVAYPTTYGNSGVMTFIVNYDGQVFQKDLGEHTGALAGAMKTFDPDASWKKQEPRTAQAN